jgi:hypothetical protein
MKQRKTKMEMNLLREEEGKLVVRQMPTFLSLKTLWARA